MQKRLIATQGLPGSGKSYWAEQERVRLESEGIKALISNKDNIRKALAKTGWTWSPEAEKDVIKFQNQQIKGAFSQGYRVVIVADTNFGSHIERLRGIAKHCEVVFEIQDFTLVPVETCIQRDAARTEGQVGAQVIKDMYNKYLAKPTRYIPDDKKPYAVICDLDGTLALHKHRSPYEYHKVDTDEVNDPIARIIQLFARAGYAILYTSGREDSCRNLTEKWLSDNRLPVDSPHMLIMRQSGDHRKDYVVKLELFDNYIRNNYNVKFVLDDRDQVVKMWREIGLTCLQVNYGAF